MILAKSQYETNNGKLLVIVKVLKNMIILFKKLQM